MSGELPYNEWNKLQNELQGLVDARLRSGQGNGRNGTSTSDAPTKVAPSQPPPVQRASVPAPSVRPGLPSGGPTPDIDAAGSAPLRANPRRPFVSKHALATSSKVHRQLFERVRELEEEVLRLRIRAEVAESSVEQTESYYEERLTDLKTRLWAALSELDEERARGRVSSSGILNRLFRS